MGKRSRVATVLLGILILALLGWFFPGDPTRPRDDGASSAAEDAANRESPPPARRLAANGHVPKQRDGDPRKEAPSPKAKASPAMERYEADEDPVAPIVGVPAVSRRVRFVSDDDRVPLPAKLVVVVHRPGGESEGLTIGSPTLVLTIDADRVAEKPVPFTVTTGPTGFMPEQRVIEVTREEVQPDVEIRLRPVATQDHATVEFLLASADAEFLRRPFDIEVRDAQRHDLVVARPAVEVMGGGRLRATVPPGNWFLRLRPADGWCNPVYWEGVQTLPEGRTTTVTWTVPLHGSAIVKVSSGLRARGASMIGLSPAGSGGGSLLPVDAMSENGSRVQALAEGSWSLRIYDKGLGTPLSEKTFDVKPGEQVEIVLGE